MSCGSRLSPFPYRQIKIKKWMAGTSLDVSSDISVACKPLRWAGMHGQPAPLLLWNMFGKDQLLRLALRNRVWPHARRPFCRQGSDAWQLGPQCLSMIMVENPIRTQMKHQHESVLFLVPFSFLALFSPFSWTIFWLPFLLVIMEQAPKLLP